MKLAKMRPKGGLPLTHSKAKSRAEVRVCDHEYTITYMEPSRKHITMPRANKVLKFAQVAALGVQVELSAGFCAPKFSAQFFDMRSEAKPRQTMLPMKGAI